MNAGYASYARKSRTDRILDGIGRAIGTMLVQLLVGTLTAMFFGLWLMLAVGVVHHEWIPTCPTIGYWWACVLAGLIRAVIYQLPDTSKDGSR